MPTKTAHFRIFQSTLPYGSDGQCLGCRLDKANISILAPLRERLKSGKYSLPNVLFQSTLPYGSDLGSVLTAGANVNFNPRSLAGATSRTADIRRSYPSFNPRSLTGATPPFFICSAEYDPFQSTLPHRSDAAAVPAQEQTQRISIHAPSQERLIIDNGHGHSAQFQSTLPHRSDRDWRVIASQAKISIHAPSQERLAGFLSAGSVLCISIHAPSQERPLKGWRPAAS